MNMEYLSIYLVCNFFNVLWLLVCKCFILLHLFLNSLFFFDENINGISLFFGILIASVQKYRIWIVV